ncbi:hypothetical protein [Bacillus cereus]|uniref:hypothetical protein n=1 Tax=Bacillus cereus TaxID=1396 RepID=UPI001EE008B7|nr:hypothetical protein [Bacillus cereus]
MKKTLNLCTLSILFLILIGCSNASSKSSVQKEKQESAKGSIQLNAKDIQEIRLDPTEKDNLSKTQTDNEELIEAITRAINTGTTKEIQLDKKVRNTIQANMTVTLNNGAKEQYLVWVNNKKEITIAKDIKEDHVQGILINSKDAKLANKFFENKNSTDCELHPNC